MKRLWKPCIAFLIAVVLSNCAGDASSSASGPRSSSANEKNWSVTSVAQGKASWYSVKTNAGTRTASGERLQNDAYTAAHKTLPMGTHIRVTNIANGKSEILRITDRGPHIRGRILDVTIGCAQRLGFYTRGVAPVKMEVLKQR
jgi:rare lipoprotein A